MHVTRPLRGTVPPIRYSELAPTQGLTKANKHRTLSGYSYQGGGMPRAARTVLPGVPHHVTQRGVRRQRVFFSPDDYRRYLNIAAKEYREAGVEVWSYCLMPNHVHLIVVPSDETGMARAVSRTHQRYAFAINSAHGFTGHLWQGRFSSFPMDDRHLIRCVRYVGLNPVRAGLVKNAAAWPWSSVRAHAEDGLDRLVMKEPVAQRLGAAAASFFQDDMEEEEIAMFRNASAKGRPLIALGQELTPAECGQTP